MIIRRLAEAIRDQHWFTVFIEFVIVVAGIFVGLQVNDWNEARLDRRQERESLQRLLVEAENAVGSIALAVEFGVSLIDAQRVLLEIVVSDGPVSEDTSVAEWGFETLNFFPALAPARTTFDELTASGGVRLIRSQRVRELISRYYAELDYFQAQLSYFRDFSIGAGNDPSVEAREYVRAEYDPTSEVGRRYSFDWPGLRADPYLETLFTDKLRNQIVMNQNREQLLARARIMCEAIAGEIDSECAPDATTDRSERSETMSVSSEVVARGSVNPSGFTILHRADVPDAPGIEVIMGILDRGQKSTSGKHYHPYGEFGFVADGTVFIETEEGAELALEAGASFHQAPGEWHLVRTSDAGARTVVFRVVKKGEPMVVDVD